MKVETWFAVMQLNGDGMHCQGWLEPIKRNTALYLDGFRYYSWMLNKDGDFVRSGPFFKKQTATRFVHNLYRLTES